MTSLAALQSKRRPSFLDRWENPHKPNDDLMEDETFRRIYFSAREMVQRINRGETDNMLVPDVAQPEALASFQWHSLTAKQIVETVAFEADITVEAIRGRRRGNNTAKPRQLACWLMRQYTSLSLPEIGQVVNKDHTTVIHACNVMDEELKRPGRTKDLYLIVKQRLGRVTAT